MGFERASRNIDSFPLFLAWIQELHPEPSGDDAGRLLEDKLNAILVNKLRRSGFFDGDDITDCRNDVFMLLEKKLREPMEFRARSVRADPAGSLPLEGLDAEVMHLLRAEPFNIIAYHEDFRAWFASWVRLRDIASGGEILRISAPPNVQQMDVAIRLSYDTLRHEQEALVELSRDGEASSYYARVRAVCHESFAIRMGFVTTTARNIARGHLRKGEKDRSTESLDDLPPGREPWRRDHGQDAALLALTRDIGRLPTPLRAQLRQRYVECLPWSEVARLRGVTEVKVRQDDWRLMKKLAGDVVSNVPQAPKGAVARVVSWLKETLPGILERE